MCIVLLEPGINFTVFEKGDKISDDPSICFSSHCQAEEDWANDLPMRYGTAYTHFQWMKTRFLVHVRVV